MRTDRKIPRNAYVAVAFMDDGTNVTDFLTMEREPLCLGRTSNEYCTDYLEAKKLAKERFGNKANVVILTKVQGLLDMKCSDILEN